MVTMTGQTVAYDLFSLVDRNFKADVGTVWMPH